MACACTWIIMMALVMSEIDSASLTLLQCYKCTRLEREDCGKSFNGTTIPIITCNNTLCVTAITETESGPAYTRGCARSGLKEKCYTMDNDKTKECVCSTHKCNDITTAGTAVNRSISMATMFGLLLINKLFRFI